MRIVCPSCAAEYEVPASRLAPRKIVRCARCGGKWAPLEEAEEQQPVPDPADPPADHAAEHREEPADPVPSVTAMDRLTAPRPSPPRSASLTAAWVMTFVLLTAAVAATFTWRERVVRAWPPSGRILGPEDHLGPVPAQVPGKAAEEPRPAKQ